MFKSKKKPVEAKPTLPDLRVASTVSLEPHTGSATVIFNLESLSQARHYNSYATYDNETYHYLGLLGSKKLENIQCVHDISTYIRRVETTFNSFLETLK